MSISASQIVEVNPGLLKPGGVDLELNGLILTYSDLIPAENVIAAPDIDTVTNIFGEDSDENAMAQIYFLGPDNSQTKPKVLYFYNASPGPLASWIRGGEITVQLSTLTAITAGTLKITFNSVLTDIIDIDLSSSTSFSDVALLLQTAIQGKAGKSRALDPISNATVTYSSLTKSFQITNGSTGTLSTIDFCSGTVAEALNLTLKNGAILSQGVDVRTPAQIMESVLTQTQNFVPFTTTWVPTKQEVIDYATWANSKGVAYLFVYADNDPRLKDENSVDTIAYALKDLNISAVAGEFGDRKYSAFVLGISGSIDYTRVQGSITTAFKTQSGLPANVDRSVDAFNLIGNKMNFYGAYSTRNDQAIFHYPGQMFGQYGFIDTYLNAVWLNNAIQVALLNGLRQTRRVPYTTVGYTLVKSWIEDPVNRAIRNGVIDSGVVLTNQQSSQVDRDAGLPIAAYIQQYGYYIQVVDPGAQVRVLRESPNINFWYTYGGSIQKLEVASVAIV